MDSPTEFSVGGKQRPSDLTVVSFPETASVPARCRAAHLTGLGDLRSGRDLEPVRRRLMVSKQAWSAPTCVRFTPSSAGQEPGDLSAALVSKARGQRGPSPAATRRCTASLGVREREKGHRSLSVTVSDPPCVPALFPPCLRT